MARIIPIGEPVGGGAPRGTRGPRRASARLGWRQRRAGRYTAANPSSVGAPSEEAREKGAGDGEGHGARRDEEADRKVCTGWGRFKGGLRRGLARLAGRRWVGVGQGRPEWNDEPPPCCSSSPY